MLVQIAVMVVQYDFALFGIANHASPEVSRTILAGIAPEYSNMRAWTAEPRGFAYVSGLVYERVAAGRQVADEQVRL